MPEPVRFPRARGLDNKAIINTHIHRKKKKRASLLSLTPSSYVFTVLFPLDERNDVRHLARSNETFTARALAVFLAARGIKKKQEEKKKTLARAVQRVN